MPSIMTRAEPGSGIIVICDEEWTETELLCESIPPPPMKEKTFLQVALLTRIACLTGEPALSVPCGFTTTGLPLGAHIQGKRFNEATVYRVAHVYEQATEWHRRRPPVT